MTTRSVNAAVRRLQSDLEKARPKRRWARWAEIVLGSMAEPERPEGWAAMQLDLTAPPSPKLAAMIAASTAPAGADAVMPVQQAEPQPPVSAEAAVITVEHEVVEVEVVRTTRTRVAAETQIHSRTHPAQSQVLHGDDRLRPGDFGYCADLDEPGRPGIGRAATERDLGSRR